MLQFVILILERWIIKKLVVISLLWCIACYSKFIMFMLQIGTWITDVDNIVYKFIHLDLQCRYVAVGKLFKVLVLPKIYILLVVHCIKIPTGLDSALSNENE